MTVTADINLENYILEQEIGRGDVTIVYRGRRKSDDAVVAIKVVAPQFTFDEYFVKRFRDITRQTTRLEHPNIVRTYEANQEGDALYIVREFIDDARPLAQVLEEEGSLGPQRMLAIAKQIASALDYAHQKSIMHGDLSASRIFLGPNDHVIVADFGQTQAMIGTSLVKQGCAIGAPEIIAPERVHGQGPSRQSDLYSLGILCYQMLNKVPPFTGAPAAVLHAQAYEQPRPLHVVNPGISVPLSEAIGRMLSKGLELRYNTGAEFTRALGVATQGAAPVRVSSASGAKLDMGVSKSIWRRPWLWALIVIPVIIALLVAGFLTVTTWVTLSPPTATDGAAQLPVESDSPTPAQNQVAPTSPVEPTATATEASALLPTATPSLSPSPTSPPPTPTATPTFAPLPTPGPPTIAQGSPFANLKLAHGISNDNQPEKVGTAFAPGPMPVYVFFDYANIEAGTTWAHRWTWGDTELGFYEDTWPDNYFETGTAWVYYSPTGGYQPGPYQVTLEVEGSTVATATFVIEPGGL